MEKLLFSRHLDEIDDLEKYGRDAPLIESLANKKRLDEISNTVLEKVIREKKEAIIFVTSPKVRAKQTAALVAENIKKSSEERIKVRFSVNEDLRATDQGDFILPADYIPGEVFEGLKLAGKCFDLETHGSDVPGGIDNIDYRFADPGLQRDGTYKYPELVKYFTSYGESYRESLVRIYSLVIATSEKYKKLLNKTEIVVVAHGQIYHVFRGLLEIQRLVAKGELTLKQGDSVKLLWKIYKECTDDQKVTGICLPLDFECLDDQSMMDFLAKEIEFLKSDS